VSTSEHHIIFRVTLALGLVTGTVGVGGLVFGCFILVEETRLAVKNVAEEAKLVRERFKDYLSASEKAGEPG